MARIHGQKPYPDPGVLEVARSMHHWIDDIRAYLAERELSTTLAETVADMMDAFHYSLKDTVDQLERVLRSEGT